MRKVAEKGLGVSYVQMSFICNHSWAVYAFPRTVSFFHTLLLRGPRQLQLAQLLG